MRADGIVNPDDLLFSDEAWLHLGGHVITQHKSVRSSENTHQLHEHHLHDIKIGVWSAVIYKTMTV
jgi:hypothetical protein